MFSSLKLLVIEQDIKKMNAHTYDKKFKIVVDAMNVKNEFFCTVQKLLFYSLWVNISG